MDVEQPKMVRDKAGQLNAPGSQDPGLISEINRLRKQKNAVILAHYYQDGAVQDIADYVGDSLGLSQEAKNTDASIVVFAGVHFMAETAKILNPEKKVLLPDLNSGCSLADGCTAEELAAFRRANPAHVVVSYINCPAGVKALSDFVCTSANAEQIIRAIPEDKPIVFVPDKNLGKYLIRKTGRAMTLWDGACVVHEAFSIEKLIALHKAFPDAQIIAHPESEEHILKVASFVGSTAGMIKYVRQSSHQTFIIATEAGILHQMSRHVPEKKLIPAPVFENNSCACSQCASMRLTTLEKIYRCLKYETPEVTVPKEIAEKALIPILKMFDISGIAT